MWGIISGRTWMLSLSSSAMASDLLSSHICVTHCRTLVWICWSHASTGACPSTSSSGMLTDSSAICAFRYFLHLSDGRGAPELSLPSDSLSATIVMARSSCFACSTDCDFRSCAIDLTKKSWTRCVLFFRQSRWQIILMQCATSTLIKHRGSCACWFLSKTLKHYWCRSSDQDEG